MSPEAGSDFSGALVWLSIYACTALAAAVSLFRVLWSRPGRGADNNSLRGAIILLALGTTPLLDMGQRLASPFGDTGRILIQAVLLLAVLAALKILSSGALHWIAPSMFGGNWGLAAGLLALAAPTIGWSSYRLRETPVGVIQQTQFPPLPVAENLSEAAEADLRTDRGVRIPAYRYANGDEREMELVAQLESRIPAYSQTAIRRGPVELATNCHGWVFADGKFIIRSSSVDRILADNEYQPVAEPQPGDLIVYRGTDNSVLHTGIVKATGKEGFALIESKWGLHGRFLHEPHEQSYSDNYAYYRSPRRGHRLNGRWKTPQPPAAATQISADPFA